MQDFQPSLLYRPDLDGAKFFVGVDTLAGTEKV